MLCPKCGKESNNLRVCGHCQTPYPVDRGSTGGTPRSTRSVAAPRASTATGAPRATAAVDPRVAMAARRAGRIRAWIVIGVLAAITAGYWFTTREREVPANVVLANFIARPMSQIEATGMLKSFEASGSVEVKGTEVIVKVAAAIFPERRDGQLALAQQYARADELIQGRKRLISFLDPAGNGFAKADPEKGVVMTR